MTVTTSTTEAEIGAYAAVAPLQAAWEAAERTALDAEMAYLRLSLIWQARQDWWLDVDEAELADRGEALADAVRSARALMDEARVAERDAQYSAREARDRFQFAFARALAGVV